MDIPLTGAAEFDRLFLWILLFISPHYEIVQEFVVGPGFWVFPFSVAKTGPELCLASPRDQIFTPSVAFPYYRDATIR